MVIWLIKSFFVQLFCVSLLPLLNLLLFLCFILSIFAWNIPLVSPIFLKRSLVFPILLFSYISLHCSLRKSFLSLLAAAAAAKSLQSCPTLCDPRDGSPPGSAIPGILQARTLGWVAISFSNAWNEKWKWNRSVVSDSSRPHGLQPTRLLCPWDFPGKSTRVGCHHLLRSPCYMYLKILISWWAMHSDISWSILLYGKILAISYFIHLIMH